MISFDLKDGFYMVAIHPQDRHYFTVEIQGRLYRLACLPMGWNASPYIFCKVVQVLVKSLRCLETDFHTPPRSGLRRRKWHPRRIHGIRLLWYMDDFLVFGRKEQMAEIVQIVQERIASLGLSTNDKKSHWDPCQSLKHLGLMVNTRQGKFSVDPQRVLQLQRHATDILCKDARGKRWVSKRALDSLCGKAQFCYLAVQPARYYLRSLHEAMASTKGWSGRVKLPRQAVRDLRWWASFPTRWNGRSIWRPFVTAELHCDASSYGWGGVLDRQHTARGFWQQDDKPQHITYKELKAVRLSLESFLPMIAGKTILLHEDNQAVLHILTHLTSRSPGLMRELRKLWWVLDAHDINLRPRYIRTVANIWADQLSRELGRDDWMFNPRLFRTLDRLWGTHSVDWFATEHNSQLPQFNTIRCCARSAGQDAFLQDRNRENNWVNPPWELLGAVVQKLHQNPNARATVIAPAWVNRPWHQQLLQTASETITYPTARDMFYPGRQAKCKGVGTPPWSVTAFSIRPRPT